MLDTVKINHVQHISFTQSRLTDAVSVILSELLSYEHPSNPAGRFLLPQAKSLPAVRPVLHGRKENGIMRTSYLRIKDKEGFR